MFIQWCNGVVLRLRKQNYHNNRTGGSRHVRHAGGAKHENNHHVHWRPPLRRALCTLLLGIAALWAMPRSAGAQLYVSQDDFGSVGEYNGTTRAAINANFITGLSAPTALALSGNNLLVANCGCTVLASFGELAESSTALDPKISAQLQKTELLLSKAVEDTQSTARAFDEYLIDSNSEASGRIRFVCGHPGRSVTFVLGDPGVGKSSLIRIIQKEIKNVQVIQLSRLGENHISNFADIAYEKDELVTSSGYHHAFGQLPAIKDSVPNWLPTIFSRLGVTNLSGTIIIDDLDEIYPDSAKRILNELVTTVENKSQDVLDVVLFGRPEAFADFYNQPHKFDFRSIEKIACNGVKDYFHTEFLIAAVSNFQSLKKIPDVGANELSKKLIDFLRQHQNLVITMANRAQSQFIIEALASGLTEENAVKNSIYNALLDRAHETHNRPTQENNQYNDLLLEIARRYASKINPEDGYFHVAYSDFIDFRDEAGHTAAVKVSDVLNRSGIARLDPVDFSQRKYRFEPFWLHRYLAEMTPNRIQKDQTSDAIQQVQDFFRDWSLPKITLFGFGIAFIVLLLVIALFVPVVSRFQEFIFRVVLSLAAAGIGASIPGFLDLHFSLPAGSIEAGGALALFVLCYAVNPPALAASARRRRVP